MLKFATWKKTLHPSRQLAQEFPPLKAILASYVAMKDIFNFNVFRLDADVFGIRSEAIVPGAGRFNGPGWSVVIPSQVYWSGDSWSQTVCREFSRREEAEDHLAANLDLLTKRFKKQFRIASSVE